MYPAIAKNLDLSSFGNGINRYLVSFSSAIIASCGKKSIAEWHEFWLVIIDYILLWNTGRLTVRDDESFDSDRTSQISSSIYLLNITFSNMKYLLCG
ncbi:hypothetical protein [Nostoc sp. DSM 114161]|uniref:hypothetical protein n=1 Tax=Nostoc sp. DSM 114161 TaxID=3440143 RepID=UPI004045E4B0